MTKRFLAAGLFVILFAAILSAWTINGSLAILNSFIELDEITDPANPAANKLRIYSNDVSGVTKLMIRDSAGTETELGASSAAEVEYGYVVHNGGGATNDPGLGARWGEPTSNTPVYGGFTSNGSGWGYATFAASVTDEVSLQHDLRADWNGTNLEIKLWGTTISAPSGSDIRWSVNLECYGVGKNTVTSAIDANTYDFTQDTTGISAAQIFEVTVDETNWVTLTGCAAGDVATFKIGRDGAHVDDGLTNAVSFLRAVVVEGKS